jgi:hypothetical protein
MFGIDKKQALIMLATALVNKLSGEHLEEAADYLLDLAEDAIERSPAQWDDKILLPLIQAVREAFGIADDDDEPEVA